MIFKMALFVVCSMGLSFGAQGTEGEEERKASALNYVQKINDDYRGHTIAAHFAAEGYTPEQIEWHFGPPCWKTFASLEAGQGTQAVYSKTISYLRENKDLGAWFENLLDASVKNNPNAQAFLGILHYLGVVPTEETFIKKYVERVFLVQTWETPEKIDIIDWHSMWSRHWINKAAPKENVDALFFLGWMYEQGIRYDVTETSDEEKPPESCEELSKTYYERAAARGSISAKRKILAKNLPFAVADQKRAHLWGKIHSDLQPVIRGYCFEAGYLCAQNDEYAFKNYNDRYESSKVFFGILGIARFLHKNYSVKNLQFRNIEIEERGIRGLGQALCFNTTLQDLDLDSNKIKDEGVLEIAHALRFNTTLQNLELSSQQIGTKGLSAVSQALFLNRTLQSLSLGYNGIGLSKQTGTKILAELLDHNTPLAILALVGNSLGDEGTTIIAASLQRNISLKSLDLRNNQIGMAGAYAIASALHDNTSLRVLYLQRNKIEDEAAKILAKCLPHNNSLKTLNLAFNQIGDDGAKEMALSLQENTSLRQLELGNNQIGIEGVKAFLPYSLPVVTVSLSDNPIGEEGLKALKDSPYYDKLWEGLSMGKD